MDFEVQRREAQDRRLEMAWVIHDPERRPLARSVGLPVFNNEEAAQAHLTRRACFPPIKTAIQPPSPAQPWWKPSPKKPKTVAQNPPPGWLLLLEGIVLLVVIAVVAAALALSVPSAQITLYPMSANYTQIVPISVDPELEQVDLQRGVIPSERVGEEFEGFAEVVTSGQGYVFSGRAEGRILLTNLLGQEYQVPVGTVVRTSAGSYPVRYQTTASVTLPPFGQAEAPVSALVEGPRGNVDAYQINFVEGVVGVAVRVTNPQPISGADTQTVRTVSQADRDRVRDLATQQIMAQAYDSLHSLSVQELGRFLPRQSLTVQATPRAAYSHIVGEQTDVLGLSLRLLITGEAVTTRDAEAIAYRQLVEQLPTGYTLREARFEYGEAAEEDVGPGRFTFYVTAYGYAIARIDTQQVQDLILGKPVEAAEAALQTALPLAYPPEISVTPGWFPYVPFLPIRTQVEVVPDPMAP